jgi:hypothetical protein
VTFRLAASRPPEDLPVRACGCRFCRQHAALSTSDPDGHVIFQVADPARLARYRFGLKTADFLICGFKSRSRWTMVRRTKRDDWRAAARNGRRPTGKSK